MQQVFDLTYTTSLVDLHLECLHDCVYVRACVRVCVCVACLWCVCVRACVRVLILLVFKTRLPDR